MSKVIRTQKPSVLPWYAAALVFAVLCAALPAYKLWALLLALGGAAVMFGAAKKVCPPRISVISSTLSYRPGEAMHSSANLGISAAGMLSTT